MTPEDSDVSSADYIRINEKKYYVYDVFMDGEIDTPDAYRDLRHLLRKANEEDQINIFINSVGGNLYSALGIIESINKCVAHVHCIVEGECFSAATLIMLAGDSIEVTDSCAVMCHSAHYGAIGNVANVKQTAEFVDRVWKAIERKTYSGFLTDKEIVDLGKGLEFYFDATATRARIQKWQLKHGKTVV